MRHLKQISRGPRDAFAPFQRLLALALGSLVLAAGCSSRPPGLKIEPLGQVFSAGTIVDTANRRAISFAELIKALDEVKIVYVGESHLNPDHHDIQQRVIEALADRHPGLAVGLEMFDTTYQPVLDQWRQGNLDEKAFLEKSHWYANWRYPYSLYRELMETIRKKGLLPVALNVPFHIPPKIAVGGLESIFGDDRRHLPEQMDLTDEKHRAFLTKVFEQHRIPGRSDFEKFYQAQVTWEEAMAEAVSAAAQDSPMVVLAGSGHLREKFGIPLRVFRRNHLPFRTILPVSAGGSAELSQGDYLWITPKADKPGRFHPPVK